MRRALPLVLTPLLLLAAARARAQAAPQGATARISVPVTVDTLANGLTLIVHEDHSVPNVGSRWEGNGRTMFYTGDTGPGGSWVDLVSGVDVLISEASYQEATKDPSYPHHLSAADAAAIARSAGAGALVLTHIPPYLDVTVSISEAERVFDRPVRLAVPGTSFDV